MIKKSIIVFCFSAVSLLAEKEVGLSLGAGTVLKSSPYKNGKNKLFVLPHIDGKYENFYIRGLEIGRAHV